MRKYLESNGHAAWHLREHSLHAGCYVNFITSVHCVFTTGQALHWAKHLMCFIISLNHMRCDYILCTSEETHRVAGSGPKSACKTLGFIDSSLCHREYCLHYGYR